jgi:hypothetical protein
VRRTSAPDSTMVHSMARAAAATWE